MPLLTYQQLSTCSSRKQNACDLCGTLDVAVVASVYFVDLPSVSTSLVRKRLEKRPSGVFFRNTAYERGWNFGLMVLAKMKRFLKAPQTEITQPVPHKVSGLSWFEAPQIQLTFSAR